MPAAPAPRPFLKWAGGKTQLLEALIARVPRAIDAYYEPFIGGGALFFALAAEEPRRFRRAVLGDLNAELITAFETVRDAPQRLIERLAVLESRYFDADPAGREACYYALRDEQPRAPLEIAARLIFLNKTCYNGLYRVNRQGRFNVPHGRYRRPRILDAETLLAASRALAGAELRRDDFEAICAGAGARDFVYFDPPFRPLSATSSFTSYTRSDFDDAEQLRLKWYVDEITARGVRALLSDSPHPFVQGMYRGSHYRVEETPARRAINSRGDRRGPVGELLVTNYDPPDGPVLSPPPARSSAK